MVPPVNQPGWGGKGTNIGMGASGVRPFQSHRAHLSGLVLVSGKRPKAWILVALQASKAPDLELTSRKSA